MRIDTMEKERALLLDLAAFFASLISLMLWYFGAFLHNRLYLVSALAAYLVATVLAIAGGAALKKIISPREQVEFNNHYHKWVVVGINGGMGTGCFVYLFIIAPMSQAFWPLTVLVISGVLYFLSWATRLIRPHSFWARFRSVLMRALLTTIVCLVIWWPWGAGVALVAVLPAIVVAWQHLRRDQKIFGWANR